MNSKEKTAFKKQITEYLKHQNKYNDVDEKLIQLFIDELSLCNDLAETLKSEGQFLTATNGMKYTHPAVKVRNLASKNVLAVAKLLGITPMARKLADMNTDERQLDKYSKYD